MDSLQRTFEDLFSPPLDSTLIAVIVNDYRDFDSCYDALKPLADEANLALEKALENESSSGNSSSNFRGSSEPSSGETGDGSIASLECSVEDLSIGDELGYTSTCSTTDDERGQHYDLEYADFLKICFPMFPEDRIDTLLQENDDNAEMVLDVILNEMYLETEKQEEYLYSIPPISMKNSNYTEGNSLVSEPHFKHRKKKRKQKQNNIIFQNNGHRPNSNRSLPPSSSATLGPPSPISSHWNTPWALKNPQNKFDYESQDEFIDDNKLSKLIYIFPSHDFEVLKQTLINCKGEVHDAIEMLLSGDLKGNKRQTVTQSKGNYQRSYASILQSEERSDSIQNHTISHKIYDDDNDYGLIDYEDGYDHGYCRKEALRCFTKRSEAFQKANEAYRRKDGTASYHSDEGWKFDEEMKRWNLRAARSLVKKQSVKKQDEFILDLHGCSVKDALIIVKEWLNDWYPKRLASTMKPLQIITGKGNHSLNGVAKLPNAINRFLEKENWNITKHKGFVLVNSRG